MPLDALLIDGLRTEAVLGAWPWEQKIFRPVVIDAALFMDCSQTIQTDDISCALNYTAVSETMIAFTQHHPFLLLETLTHRLADHLFVTYPTLLKLRLTVHKPGAVPQAHNIRFRIERDRP